MKCELCGDDYAYAFRWVQTPEGIVSTGCDRCGGTPTSTFHDVYFKEPYFDEHLGDPNDVQTHGGQWVTSRAHKAELLKKYNLREAGDRVRGTNGWDPISHKHGVESLQRRKK